MGDDYFTRLRGLALRFQWGDLGLVPGNNRILAGLVGSLNSNTEQKTKDGFGVQLFPVVLGVC